jgi:hypothetical protein
VAHLVLLAVFAFVGLFFVSAFFRISNNPHKALTGRSNATTSTVTSVAQGNVSTPEKNPLTRRRLYPYSVIPGGVGSNQELKNAIARDPVVAAHYAGFVVAKIHIVRLDDDRLAYVSYRLGNVVFWTKHRLKIPAGETLITDGESMARTRCGNRLSDSPKTPVSREEPPATLLETPTPPTKTPLVAYNSPSDLPLTPSPGVLKPVQHDPILVPPFVWIPVGGSPAPGLPVPPSYPPYVAVPEPGTLLLLSTGFSAIWLARKRQRR